MVHDGETALIHFRLQMPRTCVLIGCRDALEEVGRLGSWCSYHTEQNDRIGACTTELG